VSESHSCRLARLPGKIGGGAGQVLALSGAGH
jgi:hypothetical protein